MSARIRIRIDTAKTEAALGRLSNALDQALRLTFFDIAENTVVGGAHSPGTPVDTGFARNSWWLGLNSVGNPVQPPLPTAQRQLIWGAVGLAADTISLGRAGDVFYLSSNCAYMRALEHGHSQQAPTGMLRLACAAAQALFEDNMRKSLAA